MVLIDTASRFERSMSESVCIWWPLLFYRAVSLIVIYVTELVHGVEENPILVLLCIYVYLYICEHIPHFTISRSKS